MIHAHIMIRDYDNSTSVYVALLKRVVYYTRERENQNAIENIVIAEHFQLVCVRKRLLQTTHCYYSWCLR